MSFSPINDYYDGYSDKTWRSWLMTFGLRWVLRFHDLDLSRKDRVQFEMEEREIEVIEE
jgi:hypothetical protein